MLIGPYLLPQPKMANAHEKVYLQSCKRIPCKTTEERLNDISDVSDQMSRGDSLCNTELKMCRYGDIDGFANPIHGSNTL